MGGRHPYSFFPLCEILMIDYYVYVEVVELSYDYENI